MEDSKNDHIQNAETSIKVDETLAQVTLTEEERKLDRGTVRRLDLILLPMTLMMYLLAWLDRANVGNARVVCVQLVILNVLEW
jgi:hypothetical protein